MGMQDCDDVIQLAQVDYKQARTLLQQAWEQRTADSMCDSVLDAKARDVERIAERLARESRNRSVLAEQLNAMENLERAQSLTKLQQQGADALGRMVDFNTIQVLGQAGDMTSEANEMLRLVDATANERDLASTAAAPRLVANRTQLEERVRRLLTTPAATTTTPSGLPLLDITTQQPQPQQQQQQLPMRFVDEVVDSIAVEEDSVPLLFHAA
jgi:hypothetical protein